MGVGFRTADEPLVAPAPLTRRVPWGGSGSIYLAMLSGLLKGEPNPPDAYGHPQPFLQQRRSLPIPLAVRTRSRCSHLEQLAGKFRGVPITSVCNATWIKRQSLVYQAIDNGQQAKDNRQ